MSNFTISSASTLMGCRFPFRSDIAVPPEGAPDASCEYGRTIHAADAAFINNPKNWDGSGFDNYILDPLEHPMWACARAWILSHWRKTWVAEPAYAWDVAGDTARLLGVDIGREYARAGKLPHEVAGTLDVCSVEGDTVYVYEFGTGYDVSHKQEQLRLQCAVAALAHGCSRAVGQLVRFADDGAYPWPAVEFSSFELDGIRGEFAEYLSEVGDSEPVPGDHCARCKLRSACPAAEKIVQESILADSIMKPAWGLTVTSPDHAAWLLSHARLVAAAADAVKDAVKAYIPTGGVVLSDGSLLVEGTRNITRRSKARLEAIARACGATDEQIASCDYIAVESAGLKVKKPAVKKLRGDR